MLRRFYSAGAEANFFVILLLPEAQELLLEQKLLLKQEYQTNLCGFFRLTTMFLPNIVPYLVYYSSDRMEAPV